MRSVPTLEQLQTYIVYDPLTGQITRIKMSSPNSKLGVVTTKDKDGYVFVNVCATQVKAHRFAWLVMTGHWPDHDVDHKDRNKANNIWLNLRAADKSKNAQNLDLRANNKSGYTGVWWNKNQKQWVSQLTIRNRKINVGAFCSAQEAFEAYKLVKAQYHLFNPQASTPRS